LASQACEIPLSFKTSFIRFIWNLSFVYSVSKIVKVHYFSVQLFIVLSWVGKGQALLVFQRWLFLYAAQRLRVWCRLAIRSTNLSNHYKV